MSPLASPLTRHLYPLHGVMEAFLECVRPGARSPGRRTRLWFWLYELFLSEEWEAIIVVCERAWSMFGYPCSEGASALRDVKHAPRDPAVLLRFLEYIHTSAVLMPAPLTWPPRDVETAGVKATIPNIPAEWSANQRRRLWVAVSEALRLQRGERLYQLLGAQPRAVAEAYTGRHFVAKGGIQHQLCLESWAPFQTSTNLGLAWPAEWGTLAVGTRGARLFGLPKHLVVSRLMHPTGLDVLDGCAFWRRVLREYGVREEASRTATGWLVFDGGDEVSDAFYNTYFPTDIPDEWSLAECEKSHIPTPLPQST